MVMQHLVPSKCLVAAIDVQERLAAAMPPDRMAVVTRKINLLLSAAELLGASVLATEQYPKGLGPTIEPIGRKLHEIGVPRIEKTVFSAVAAPEFAQRLDEVAPAIVIVVGMEAHVCVYQTVRDLVARGLEVHVPIDAVISRHDDDRTVGISLSERAGAIASTTETIIFDWLVRAGTEAFRTISKLVR
jgi:nicotinamidase-related amidase